MKHRVWALIRKEFTEYRRNKLIVLTMTILPAAFLFVAARATFALPAHPSPTLLRAVIGQARLFLLILPLFLPSTIAAYSVIGEREQGVLEPLLTTPATDGELLLAKTLAPVVPSVGLSWGLYAVYLAGAAALDLAWCACGRFDAYYERGVHEWDVAAGILIASRAGMAVRDLSAAGQDAWGVAVAPRDLIDELVALVED